MIATVHSGAITTKDLLTLIKSQSEKENIDQVQPTVTQYETNALTHSQSQARQLSNMEAMPSNTFRL
jgi:hypothetical protein